LEEKIAKRAANENVLSSTNMMNIHLRRNIVPLSRLGVFLSTLGFQSRICDLVCSETTGAKELATPSSDATQDCWGLVYSTSVRQTLLWSWIVSFQAFSTPKQVSDLGLANYINGTTATMTANEGNRSTIMRQKLLSKLQSHAIQDRLTPCHKTVFLRAQTLCMRKFMLYLSSIGDPDITDIGVSLDLQTNMYDG
jgi:hypothetical protein